MPRRATSGAGVAQRCAWLRVRRAAEAHDGFTLIEVLVALSILGIVLAGLTQLFTSAMTSQKDQTNRTHAQLDARLALDKLRREIRCGSGVAPTSGYPASAVTITLGSYCPTAGGAATTVTWCTKDKNGATPPVAGAQPYTLWRYVGATCSGTGMQWASSLVDGPSATAGKIFGANFVPAATFTQATSGGTLASGTYSYVVTAVLSGGAEVPGVVASVTVANTSLLNKITLSWSAYSGAASYNVYGRDGGMTLLKNVTSGTSYVDTGPTKLTGNPLTLPNADIGVADTSNFNTGANTIVFGASGVITCTGTTSTSFTGCSGGQAGQYPQNMPVYSASSARPPQATLSVWLALDKTPADTKQRFLLNDDIVLRNSRPSS
jgi:prepilin-type N-terminal cleavage/methylation domain-containing protein